MSSNLKRWTALEDNILMTKHHSYTYEHMRSFLPGRSLGAIKARMSKLGLRKNSNSYLAEPFTPEQDTYLRTWFKKLGVEEIKRRYMPNRTVTSIYSRAQRLGLTERSCMLPQEDIDLIGNLFMDPELTSMAIAEKFDLSAAYCHQLAWRTIHEWVENGTITQEQYLRTMVLRTAKSKARAVYLDKLLVLIKVQSLAKGEAYA